MVRGGTRDDERSAHYEALLLAEERGKKERKGLHSAKEPPVQHVNDMSLPGSANKWAPFGVSCPISAPHLYLLPPRMLRRTPKSSAPAQNDSAQSQRVGGSATAARSPRRCTEVAGLLSAAAAASRMYRQPSHAGRHNHSRESQHMMIMYLQPFPLQEGN